MRTSRLKMFIGSSGEAKSVAEAAAAILNDDVVPEIWDMSRYFQPTHNTFSSLLAAAKGYDFALFIMSPDDRIESRGEKSASSRDNVLFELGLFIGAIGPERVFAVVQTSPEQNAVVQTSPEQSNAVKIPSDLLGVEIEPFNADEVNTSLRIALRKVRERIKILGPLQQHISLRTGWAYDHAQREFSITLDPVKIEANRSLFRDYNLVLVTRRDNSKPFENDTVIGIGEPWEISQYHTRTTQVTANTDKLGDLAAKDVVWGYLMLVPKDVDPNQFPTIQKMIDAGCRLTADSVGKRVGSDEKVG